MIWSRLTVLLMFSGFAPFLCMAQTGVCPQEWPPPGAPANLPCPVDHQQTVQLEHEDRIARLRRLSAAGANATFSTDHLEPDEHKLAQYPVRIPVLRVVFDEDTFFDTDSSDIRPEAFPVLRTISENLLREPPDVALYIVGHTDSRGDENYNYNLGLSRANEVAEAIARRGIYQATVYRLSLGEGYPIADNTTEYGQARNRRVEFLFAATPRAAETFIKKVAVSPCIARDESGVQTCRRPVTIEIKKVSVSMSSAAEVQELNREERELEKRTDINSVELNTIRQKIELKRQKIPVTIQRSELTINRKS